MSSKQLADAIRIGDATLRQAIKFSERAAFRTAGQLETAGVPWRGVVFWLGVESVAQQRKLLREMLNGLTNSTAIRRHIEQHFGKAASPRRFASLERMCEEAQKKAQALAAAVAILREAHAHAEASDPKAVRRVRPLLRDLAQSVKQAGRAMAALRWAGLAGNLTRTS